MPKSPFVVLATGKMKQLYRDVWLLSIPEAPGL
jgi:hypothetical protein